MASSKRIAFGLLIGAASGLTGSWLMLRFIQGPGTRLQRRLKTPDDLRHDAAEQQHRQRSGQPLPETVTMQAADILASHLPGGRHLSRSEKEAGATVVHYTFGALMGAAYGVVAEYSRLPTLGLGSAFGLVLWVNTDLWSVPLTGLAKHPREEPPAAHIAHLLAHLVYTVGMESTRRLLRFGSARALRITGHL